jgi:hypothetical protein
MALPSDPAARYAALVQTRFILQTELRQVPSGPRLAAVKDGRT